MQLLDNTLKKYRENKLYSLPTLVYFLALYGSIFRNFFIASAIYATNNAIYTASFARSTSDKMGIFPGKTMTINMIHS